MGDVDAGDDPIDDDQCCYPLAVTECDPTECTGSSVIYQESITEYLDTPQHSEASAVYPTPNVYCSYTKY